MEPYFRKAVRKIGWVEVMQHDMHGKKGSIAGAHPMYNHQLFHIRFNIGDLEGAATDLKPN